MANEAVLIIETGPPIAFTVADGTGIEKGALLKMTDPRTAAAAAATDDIIAGIAAKEKVADDGNTSLAVYREGIFKMTASGSITVGDPVGSLASWANHVASQKATKTSGARCLGIALETATNGQTLLIEVHPQLSGYW